MVSHYVMSDLHGELDRFDKMLKKIDFSPNDTLYILGDVVDRGPDPIPLLRRVMATPNIIMLLGNHEHMMLRYFSPDATEREIRHWNRNGNEPSVSGFFRLTPEQQKETLDFISKLPTHLKPETGGQKFYLVHGFPGTTAYDEVWGRPLPDTPNPLPECTLILGHTPVLEIGRTEEETDAYVETLQERGEHVKILHTPGFIDVDCSCGYDFPVKALACLRLEDMAEFYV